MEFGIFIQAHLPRQRVEAEGPDAEHTALMGETELVRVPYPNPKMPTRNVLPKPWKKPHPPMWVAAGNPPTYEKAARLGLGVLGFNVAAVSEMEPMVRAYKGAIGEAEPVGAFVNDNVMITNGLICLEDGQRRVRRRATWASATCKTSSSTTTTRSPRWRASPCDPIRSPEPTLEDIEMRINEGSLLCGDLDEVLEQVRRYESVGCDQLVFGVPLNLSWEATLTTLRLFGEHVIPKLDPEPTRRSSRFRDAAAKKLGVA